MFLSRCSAQAQGAAAAARPPGGGPGGTVPEANQMLLGEASVPLLQVAQPSNPRLQVTHGTCSIPVLKLGGKMTMPNAGTMAYRRDLPSTTRI